MLNIRSRRLLLIGAAALAAAIALVVTAEIVVRSQLDTALDALGEGLPEGVEVSSVGGFALWSVATGRAAVEVSLDDEAVQTILECRTGREMSVRMSDGGIGVTTEIEIRGRSVPVSATLLAREQDGEWMLAPDAIVVAGLSLPPQAITRILGERAPDWLGSGVSLPSTDRLDVTGVTVTDGEAEVFVSAPLARNADAGQSPLADLGCG